MESPCSENRNRPLLAENLAFPTLSRVKGYQEKVMNRVLFLPPMRQMLYSHPSHALPADCLSQDYLGFWWNPTGSSCNLPLLLSHMTWRLAQGELLKHAYFMNIVHLISVLMTGERCCHQRSSRWAGNILVWSRMAIPGPWLYLGGLLKKTNNSGGPEFKCWQRYVL